MKARKFDYVWVIQSHTAMGWEDECEESERSEGRKRLREYLDNSPMPSRLIHRRVLSVPVAS